jgi:hypothetical protein
LHGTVGGPPPCQQCRHDRHCSIMPRHAAMWAQDHDNNHTWAYADVKTRRPFLQAKFTSFPSLRCTTTRSGEPISLNVTWPPGLYIRAARAPFQGDGLSRLHWVVPHHSPTSFPLLTHPIVRTLDHSTEEHALELSLKLKVVLRPKPV